MNEDEIVFDEVRYREPVRSRRPDLDRRFACLAYEVPAPDDLPVFLDRSPADAIERHALRDTTVELGGILLGHECVDDLTGTPFVRVVRSLEAKHFQNSQASFTYTHDSWEEITRERERLYPDLDVVGWYHTHPDFGVFLSSHDLFIHRHFFDQPLQVAYVVDPVRQTRGFFRWKDGAMVATGGFYLTATRSERTALARLVNDLENVTDADPSGGNGGGLSPRLEAELIAMLTRPTHSYQPATATGRQLSPLLFGLLGATLGVIGLAGVLWLNTLSHRVFQQSETLNDLRAVVKESSDRSRVALNAAVGDAGGVSPDKFIERYARTVRERDDAISQLKGQSYASNLLAAKLKDMTEEKATLQVRLEEARRYKDAAFEADELRSIVKSLRSTNEDQARRITAFDELLSTDEGRRATAIALKYQSTWYAAVFGWALSLVLAISLIAIYAIGKFPGARPDLDPTGPEPPHQIL